MDRILCKMSMDKISDKFLKYFFDINVFYYDSIDSYFSRQEPTLWRKTKFYSRFLPLVIFNVKYGFLLLYPDTLEWPVLKDMSIILGKQAYLFHALVFSFAMSLLVAKLIVVYFEISKNFNAFDFFFVDCKARKPLYNLNSRHLNKITLRAFILFYGYLQGSGIGG